jgi:hypothetical protein
MKHHEILVEQMSLAQAPRKHTSFGQRLVEFYKALEWKAELPTSIELLQPYRAEATMRCVEKFCTAFYTSNTKRLGCFGINPGRFGGGITGLSFTDPVVLRDVCGIQTPFAQKQELSATFVWSIIKEFSLPMKQAYQQVHNGCNTPSDELSEQAKDQSIPAGVFAFFHHIFLTALCPLGFVKHQPSGEVNYNFYDDPMLLEIARPFIAKSLRQQIALGLRQDVAVCFGSGKLLANFEAINREHHFFERIVALEHPRFIMQYRRGRLAEYRNKYLQTLRSCVAGVQDWQDL